METIERIKLSPAPYAGSYSGSIAADLKDAEEDIRALSPDEIREERAKLIETESRIFQARLSYDPVDADVFVEILDPVTGDVIRRLPADKAAEDHVLLRDGGALLDRMV